MLPINLSHLVSFSLKAAAAGGPANVINANYTLLHASASRAAAQATLEEKLHYKPDPFSLSKNIDV